jgi:hypothetical protein
MILLEMSIRGFKGGESIIKTISELDITDKD